LTIELPSEEEVRDHIRAGLLNPSLGGGEPPPLIVEQLMRCYFEKWAMLGTRTAADRWLEREINAMVGLIR
jgi:hypothetical protein